MVLNIDGLCKSYGTRPVLKNLNLHLKPGEVYGLLGPNGAGKTTTINILCNLIRPDRGTITINNLPLSSATLPLIGVAPQENLLYRSLSCLENLDFFAKIYGIEHRQRQRQVRACLEAVNLIDRASCPVETLSGGMQRRLNIAVALVHQPQLLILDEPTTGLDIEARYDIWELIRNLQRQEMTILLTTHFLDEAERLCQRIGIIKNGTILTEGSLESLRRSIPADTIVILQTSQETEAIACAQKANLPYRRYGRDLAFWLPQAMEIPEILAYFPGVAITGISCQPVRLEHIYLEATQSCQPIS